MQASSWTASWTVVGLRAMPARLESIGAYCPRPSRAPFDLGSLVLAFVAAFAWQNLDVMVGSVRASAALEADPKQM